MWVYIAAYMLTMTNGFSRGVSFDEKYLNHLMLDRDNLIFML